MNNQIKFLHCILILLVINAPVFSQITERKACIGNIATANNLYEKAQFAQAIALLEPCLKSGALKNNRVDAYRIIGLCYQQMNDDNKRDDAIYHLLKAKPDYQLFPYNDPVEFTNTLNQYKVEKSLIVGLKTGFNFSAPIITQARSLKPATIEISGNSGQFLGAAGDYFLAGGSFAIGSWLTFTKLIFSETHTFNSQERLSYKQEENLVDFGAALKYFPMKKSRVMPHIALGIGSLFYRNGLSNIVYTNDFSVTKTESSRDLQSMANKVLLNGIADFGVSTKTGTAILCIGIQYQYAFTHVLNPNTRYSNIEYIIATRYVDSDVKLNHFNLYLNYSFPVLWRVTKSKQ